MVPSQSETPASEDRTAAERTSDSAEARRQIGAGTSEHGSSDRRVIPWAYVVAGLAITFFLLHLWVLDGPKGPEGEDLREDRVARGFQGAPQVDLPYEVARFTYSLIAHTMIIIATWYFSRGWHGLLVFLLVSLTCYSSQGFAMGAHNMIAAFGIHRLDLLVWFYGVLMEYSLCFFLALLLKPLAAIRSSSGRGRIVYELSDAMWITFAAAFVALAWSRVEPPGGNIWPILRCVSMSLIAAATVLILVSSRRLAGVLILLIGIGLQGLASHQMKTPVYDLMPGGILSRGIDLSPREAFVRLRSHHAFLTPPITVASHKHFSAYSP